MTKKPKIAFFGTPEMSVTALDELKNSDLTPELVVTMPDRPKGRKLVLTPPPVKIWAKENNIKCVQPEKLNEEFLELIKKESFDLFVVVSYGKIFKQEVLDIPKHGTLNIHPSLLPKFRGASPIISAILSDEKKTGVTIMLLDTGVDSGPILAQKEIDIEPWPIKAEELEKLLMTEGGKILAEIIPKWIAGEIKPQEQNHDKATFTQKIKKEDSLIDLNADPYQNLLKIKAFDKWPGTYFFANRNGLPAQADKQIRVKITDADLEDGELKINKVIPESKKEMLYEDFLRG